VRDFRISYYACLPIHLKQVETETHRSLSPPVPNHDNHELNACHLAHLSSAIWQFLPNDQHARREVVQCLASASSSSFCRNHATRVRDLLSIELPFQKTTAGITTRSKVVQHCADELTYPSCQSLRRPPIISYWKSLDSLILYGFQGSHDMSIMPSVPSSGRLNRS
jgi:hypothetical protein